MRKDRLASASLASRDGCDRRANREGILIGDDCAAMGTGLAAAEGLSVSEANVTDVRVGLLLLLSVIFDGECGLRAVKGAVAAW